MLLAKCKVFYKYDMEKKTEKNIFWPSPIAFYTPPTYSSAEMHPVLLDLSIWLGRIYTSRKATRRTQAKLLSPPHNMHCCFWMLNVSQPRFKIERLHLKQTKDIAHICSFTFKVGLFLTHL